MLLVKVSAVMLCKASSCTDYIWGHMLVINGLIDTLCQLVC